MDTDREPVPRDSGWWKEPMTDLLLRERDQAALRAVLAFEPVPGVALAVDSALHHLSRLIPSDAIGIARLDGTGTVVGDVDPRQDRTTEDHPYTRGGLVLLGVQHRRRLPTHDGSGRPGVDVLALGVRSGPRHVVQLWMVRRTSVFSAATWPCSTFSPRPSSASCGSHRGRRCLRRSRSRSDGCFSTWPQASRTARSRNASSSHPDGAQAPGERLPQARRHEPARCRHALERAAHRAGSAERTRRGPGDAYANPADGHRAARRLVRRGQEPRAADTTSRASACTWARWSGPRKDSA